MDFERIVVRQPVNGVPVNVIRIGDTVIDTGHMLAPSRPVIEAELDDGRLAGVKNVVITHPHSDHIGGSQSIPALAELPHTVYEGVPVILRDFNNYLEGVRAELITRTMGLNGPSPMAEEYFPRGAYAETDIAIDRVVRDGDIVTIGSEPFEVLYTPGHSAQHMSLFHTGSGTLLSGDLLTPNGFAYGPLTADIGAFIASLERVENLNPTIVIPGHGPPIENPTERITTTRRTVTTYRTRVREALEEHGELSTPAVVDTVFDDDPRPREFLTLIASEYLLHLASEDSIAVEHTNMGLIGRVE